MFDVHTIADPIRHYGCYGDPAVAKCVADHLAGVLNTPMVVDEVDTEPWLPHLMPRSAHDLPDYWQVWVSEVRDYTVGHSGGRGGVAPCGAPVISTPIAAGHLVVLWGSLCLRCWPQRSGL